MCVMKYKFGLKVESVVESVTKLRAEVVECESDGSCGKRTYF